MLKTERRLKPPFDGAKSTDLPSDYLEMVREVFSTNFASGLKAMEAIKRGTQFSASGAVHPNELILCVSLVHEASIAATSIYASVDFDPKASAPTLQDLLSVCIDAVGGIYAQLLDPTKEDSLEQLANESLAALEGVPIEWTPMEVDKFMVFLKVDKANPLLESMADDWLKKHDPELQEREERESKETEALFVTGPKKSGGTSSGSSGPIH